MTESDTLARFDYDLPDAGEDIIPFGKDLATLRQVAAMVEQRTGLKMRVAYGEWNEVREEDGEHVYEVMTEHALGGPAPFEATYAWLAGYENGAAEMAKKQKT